MINVRKDKERCLQYEERIRNNEKSPVKKQE